MLRHLTGCRRSGGRPAGIDGPFTLCADLMQSPFQVRFQERVSSHVPRLLLAPDELCFGEAAELLHQSLQRYRIELLDAQEVDIVDPALLALLIKVIVDLA